MMAPRLPLHPAHPERTCWGCDKYCPADDMACGGGTIRGMHPVELFGEDWLEWEASRAAAKKPDADGNPAVCNSFVVTRRRGAASL